MILNHANNKEVIFTKNRSKFELQTNKTNCSIILNSYEFTQGQQKGKVLNPFPMFSESCKYIVVSVHPRYIMRIEGWAFITKPLVKSFAINVIIYSCLFYFSELI